MAGPDEAKLEIRTASIEDREAVVSLLMAQLRDHDISTAAADVARTVETTLHRPRRGLLLLALQNDRPVGVAALSFVTPIEHGRRSAWLEELYVVPGSRGAGIGSRLLEAVCDGASRAGATAVDLEVDSGHERAANLYARHGFRTLSRTRWVRPLIAVAPRERPRTGAIGGGCFCGAIRYRATGKPREVSHCHCSICRRTSGAPFVTWATFPAAAFELTSGNPASLRSTPHALRTFCAACGTPLTFREDGRPDVLDVTAGSMDDPGLLEPDEHIWTQSQLPWLHIDDDLPRHPADAARQ